MDQNRFEFLKSVVHRDYDKKRFDRLTQYFTQDDLKYLFYEAEQAYRLRMTYENTGVMMSRQALRNQLQEMEKERDYWKEQAEKLRKTYEPDKRLWVQQAVSRQIEEFKEQIKDLKL